MKLKLVTAAMFLSLIISTAAGFLDASTHHRHSIWFTIWILGLVIAGVFAFWCGVLLERRP